jgi:hypothetical protein
MKANVDTSSGGGSHRQGKQKRKKTHEDVAIIISYGNLYPGKDLTEIKGSVWMEVH